jgi:hypothetical protein
MFGSDVIAIAANANGGWSSSTTVARPGAVTMPPPPVLVTDVSGGIDVR